MYMIPTLTGKAEQFLNKQMRTRWEASRENKDKLFDKLLSQLNTLGERLEHTLKIWNNGNGIKSSKWFFEFFGAQTKTDEKHLKAELLRFLFPKSFSTTQLCLCVSILMGIGRNWLHLEGERQSRASTRYTCAITPCYCFAIYFHWTLHLSMTAIENDKTIFILVSISFPHRVSACRQHYSEIFT